jgi:DNA-binding MarR family transcriptional regulator
VTDAVDAILEQWRKERPDLDVTPMGVIGRISRLARRFDRAIAENFVSFELGPDEFDLLATLRRTGKPYELNPCDLVESMMVSSATTTHRLDKLEARQLIERRRDPTDRRAVLVRLTPAGKTLVDRALVAHVNLEHELLAGLDSRERAALAELLGQLVVGAVSPS